jgi:hypothetical protein
MTARRILLIAIGIGLVALTWWLIENMTWEEVRIPGRPKGEAVLNPLFAAERLLNELGASATSARSFKGVPTDDPTRSAIVLPTYRRTLKPDQRAALESWVEAGGHLVVVNHEQGEESGRRDPLMERLGVTSTPKWKPKKSGVPGAADKSDDKSDENDDQDVPPDVPGPLPLMQKTNKPCPKHQEVTAAEGRRFPAQYLHICLNTRFKLGSTKPAPWSLREDSGSVHALMLPLGKGRVTVLADSMFMKNSFIGEADHADALVAILGPDVKGLSVLLVPSEDVPGLHKLIWQHGAAVLLTLLVLLAVLLWRAGTRLGPVAARGEPVRRSLLEHVSAMGEFIWRERNASALWKSAVARTRKRIARVMPPTRNTDTLIQALAKKSGLPEALIRESLFPSTDPDPDRFARAIATLEKLRKSL